MTLVDYWEGRYASGKDSGAGSRGDTATWKAEFVNDLIASRGVTSLIDWGCGDGAQAELLRVDAYLGVDVSATAITRCRQRLPDRQFFHLHPAIRCATRADLALSMDVLFHLVDDDDFYRYLDCLFGSALQLVCIYSTDFDADPVGHMRRRRFTPTIDARFPGWRLIGRTRPASDDPEEATFYVYERTR